MGKVVKSVTGALGGAKVPTPKAMAGAQFQNFGYTSLAGTATGKKEGKDGFNFSQELTPELQSLYGAGMGQAQPLLSQYLQQSQAPVQGFQSNEGLDAATNRYFAEQQQMLDPVFQDQRQALQQDLFGSGRMGLQIAGSNPDAAGLAQAQSQALINASMQARQMAANEQQQMFGQDSESYRLNQAAQQQQLQNLLGGFQGAFGTGKEVIGLEQGLIGQAAGLEEARARAMAGSANAGAALTPAASSGGGLFGSIAAGFGASAGAPLAAKAGSWLTGLSDVRLKRNIKPLGKLGSFNIYSWDWSEKGKSIASSSMPTVGVLAQEVLDIMPEAIITGDDGYYRVDYGKVFGSIN